MEFDPLILSRIQFAANITFHIMFPSITIGLAWILLFFKIKYQATRDYSWMNAYFFYTKIFALSFAIGVVSGITMSFQFGTNWPGFMGKVGNIAGPLLAYEVLTAFFLEATFLGIMLFGFRKVPNWLHTISTSLVAFGTTFSAFWIIALNSWMHTPTGFEEIDGEIFATDWISIIFNPSMPYRFFHMLLASGLTASFLIAGLSAYRYLNDDHYKSEMIGLRVGIILAALLIPIQIFAGHEHGINTKKYQPAKLAAIEAAWETERGAPMILFALPSEVEEKNHYSIEIPYLASLITTHSFDGEIEGLKNFDRRPPVATVFFSFRIMVGIAMLMLAVSWFGTYLIVKKRTISKYFAYILVAMTFSGCIATIAGWYVTEIGRQPWLVQGILTTAEAIGPVSSGKVLSSLIVYLGIYAFLTISYVTALFYLAKKAGHGGSTDPEKQQIGVGERMNVFSQVK